MSAVFIGTSSDCVCATKECAFDTTRDAVVEGSGCERDLKLAWFRHGLLLQLTTVDTLPGNSTLHSAMCLNFYLLCACPVKLFCLIVNHAMKRLFVHTNITLGDQSALFGENNATHGANWIKHVNPKSLCPHAKN